jgi:hypothetical protein
MQFVLVISLNYKSLFVEWHFPNGTWRMKDIPTTVADKELVQLLQIPSSPPLSRSCKLIFIVSNVLINYMSRFNVELKVGKTHKTCILLIKNK